MRLPGGEGIAATAHALCWTSMQDPATGQLLSEDELAPNIATFLVAGGLAAGHALGHATHKRMPAPALQGP